jgi:hypothetical protein
MVDYESHTATDEDRAKDSYLSADSKVITKKKPLKNYQVIAKSKAKAAQEQDGRSPKAKAYDNKHGMDAHYYRYTKSGQAQSKAYDKYFGPNKESK